MTDRHAEKLDMPFDPIIERTEYVREVTQLKLWHVRQLTRHEDVDFDTAVSSRVGINRLTIFWGDPRNKALADPDGWSRIVRELRDVFEQHENDPTTNAIETEGLELLWPHLEPVIEAHVAEDARWLSDSFGCFRYEFVPYYADRDPVDHLTLHVRNAYQPDTMFQHVPELIGSLQEIVGRAKTERPDVECAQCGSWLNSLPPFSELFPPAWAKDAQPGLPGGHSGWWGQFMNRRGGFHTKNAQRFRETGEFPFKHLLSRCRLDDLQRHLKHTSS